ncbi:DUF2179 domain-containing protein [bacterium]|nr:DUF2179 domain-containing protein [bacterium]
MDFTLPGQWLALLIFFARIVDVTLGTLRTILVVRGRLLMSSLLGFVEVSIWIIVITRVMKHLDNPWNMLGWAAGFAAGNAVGILVERRLAMGKMVLRIITRRQSETVAAALRGAGFGVTVFDGRGLSGPVKLLYLVLDRSKLKDVKQLVMETDPEAVLITEDVREFQDQLRPTNVPRTGILSAFKKK